MHKKGRALHKIIRGVLSDIELYGLLARGVSRLLRHQFAKKSIEVFSITWRPKSIPSVLKKFRRKSYKRLSKVTDRAGVRIVCPYLNEITPISKIVDQFLLVMDSEDKVGRDGHSSFGYASLHFLAKWNPDYAGPVFFEDLPEYLKRDFSGRLVEGQTRKELDSQVQKINNATHNLLVEIQVRTILQHAWASINRQFVYEQESDIPESVLRRLARLAAILEETDEAFAEEVIKLRSKPAKRPSIPDVEDQDLTVAYLQEYSAEVLGVELEEEQAGWTLSYAEDIGVKRVVDFEALMIATLEALETAFRSILLSHSRSLWVYVSIVAFWAKGINTPLVEPQQQLVDSYRGLVHEELFQNVLQRVGYL